MRPLAAVGQLRQLARVSAVAARTYGTRRLDAARLARRLRVEGGYEYHEALKEGLLSPRRSDEERRAMVSRYVRREAQDRLNPVALEPLSEQKLIFYEYAEALGIPVPALYGAVGRAGGWSRVSGRVVGDREAFAAFVAADLPAEFIVKPAWGLLGLDIHAFARDGEGLRDSAGGAVDPCELHDRLLASPRFDLYVVQERLRNHPAVEELVESPTLQTVRLNTLVRRDGSVALLGCMMKLATGSGDADNYRSGATGNGLTDVDAEAGTLGPLMIPRREGPGYETTSFVPGTDRRVEGWRIPLFEEARALVIESAPHFLPMRTLGWDIAITPAGPVVVETNNYWGMSFTPLDAEGRALLLEG